MRSGSEIERSSALCGSCLEVEAVGVNDRGAITDRRSAPPPMAPERELDCPFSPHPHVVQG